MGNEAAGLSRVFLPILASRRPPSPIVSRPLTLALAIACAIPASANEGVPLRLERRLAPPPPRVDRDAVRFDLPAAWLALGFTAQAIWSGRFIVQWLVSERLGRSVLPAAFFWISTVGALLLLAYAIYRKDYVMIAAYALNPIPYVRNLVLLRRHGRAGT